MRWIAGASTLVLGLIVGCRSNNRADLVEAELRTRERQIRELQDQLERERAINSTYEYQIRGAPVEPNSESIVSPGLPVREIVLGRGTGGIDEDGLPGDDGVLLVVVPRDEDRSAIKLPGALAVSLYEITPDGVKVPFTSWEIGPTALRGVWQSGLFGSGYHVRLKWPHPPSSDRVRVVVQLRTFDGRILETDKDFPVRVVRSMPIPRAIPSMPTPQISEPQAIPSMPAPQISEPQAIPSMPSPRISEQPILPPMPTDSAYPFPQPDLGPKGPPPAAIEEQPDGPSLLPLPKSTTSKRVPTVELLEPIPYVEPEQ